jgi:hypothetical protein
MSREPSIAEIVSTARLSVRVRLGTIQTGTANGLPSARRTT